MRQPGIEHEARDRRDAPGRGEQERVAQRPAGQDVDREDEGDGDRGDERRPIRSGGDARPVPASSRIQSILSPRSFRSCESDTMPTRTGVAGSTPSAALRSSTVPPRHWNWSTARSVVRDLDLRRLAEARA